MSLPVHIRLVREISRSSIATVWEGYDEKLQRKVLVKSLHPQFARDEELRLRFEREARIVASLAHPNIVRIYELHTDEEQLSLVFEFVEGQTLRDLLRAGRILPPASAIAITHEILAGLSVAHEKGIIHRDLKPENVLLSLQREVKITDFGWAMVRDLPRLTLEGALVGTPDYMAPEQAAGEEATPRTDLFAVGLMLFEMLTGQTALRGMTWQECLQELVRYQPPRFSDYREQIAPELEHILVRLLDRNPTRRFESAQAARETLEEVTGDWQLPTASEMLRDLGAEPIATELPQTAPRHPKKTRSALRFILIGVLIALIAIASGILYRKTHKPHRDVSAPSESGILVEVLPEEPRLPPPPYESEDTLRIPKTEQAVQETTVIGSVQPDTTRRDSLTAALSTALPETTQLWINSEPSAEIVVDGTKIGKAPPPLEALLLTGTHEVSFQVERFPIIPETTITLERGRKTDSLFVDLYQYVGIIDTIVAQPWARVYLDDALVDSTPGARPLFVTLNDTHTVRLEHPDYPAWRGEFFFQRGDPPRRIRVNLRIGR